MPWAKSRPAYSSATPLAGYSRNKPSNAAAPVPTGSQNHRKHLRTNDLRVFVLLLLKTLRKRLELEWAQQGEILYHIQTRLSGVAGQGHPANVGSQTIRRSVDVHLHVQMREM